MDGLTQVKYQDEKAISVVFSSINTVDDIEIFLQGILDTPVLGDFVMEDDGITIFKPIVPFTNSATYEVYHKKIKIREFTIDTPINAERPTITAIYPSTDTIPENLLKMYLVFSQPMQEVKGALDFIEVYNITDDLPTTIFLALDNELWNSDHTALTLWLDPGRIKTDLIPNRTKGLPIEAGKQYKITISNTWNDAQNNSLDKEYIKYVYVVSRDSEKINLENWSVNIPLAGTRDRLMLDAKESLDAMLALETVRVIDTQNNIVAGVFKLADKERRLLFVPTEPWVSGNYIISVLSELEDLAGHNLNHLFDKDLLQKTSEIDKEQYTIDFTID